MISQSEVKILIQGGAKLIYTFLHAVVLESVRRLCTTLYYDSRFPIIIVEN
jgi:hypothetical protein